MNIADPEKKLGFVEQCQGQPLVPVSVITCMAVLNLLLDEVCALVIACMAVLHLLLDACVDVSW